MEMGSGCGSHSPHQITFPTANPFGVSSPPKNITIKVDIGLMWSLQTNRPQNLQAARAGSSQCQHFIFASYETDKIASVTLPNSCDQA
jgi:hypothetical protein